MSSGPDQTSEGGGWAAFSDETLATRAGIGSLAAFTELVHRYERRLYNFLLRRCGHAADAEDLTQSAFVEAWRSVGRYSPRWRFSTWLYTIGFRQAVHLHRRRHRNPEVADSTTLRLAGSEDEPPDGPAIAGETRDNIWRAAEEALNDEQRSALWLHYVEGLSMRDIAEVLGKAPATARVIVFRAREKLKRHLEADGARKAPEDSPTECGSSGLLMAAGEAKAH